MSHTHYITSIPLFEGTQCKYYIINGIKYHSNFPIIWALNHKAFVMNDSLKYTGPIECKECEKYGKIRGVFVGYCFDCIRIYNKFNQTRGREITNKQNLNDIENIGIEILWQRYPYMYGVKLSEIGDEPNLPNCKNLDLELNYNFDWNYENVFDSSDNDN